VSEPLPTPEPIPAFTPTPSFEQIPATEPIPASEELPVEALDATNEMKSMPSWELHLRSSEEDEQNFWQVFVPSSHFIIFISSVMLELLRWCWHREVETEQKLTQLQMNLQGSKSFVGQLRAPKAFMQEEQDKHWAQFQYEMELVKEVMKANERHLAQFLNVMDFIKIKVWDEHLSQLQNQMGLTEEVMKVKGKRCDKIQKKMNSMKVVVERWLLVPREQTV
jgi:hypothetical protein